MTYMRCISNWVSCSFVGIMIDGIKNFSIYGHKIDVNRIEKSTLWIIERYNHINSIYTIDNVKN